MPDAQYPYVCAGMTDQRILAEINAHLDELRKTFPIGTVGERLQTLARSELELRYAKALLILSKISQAYYTG